METTANNPQKFCRVCLQIQNSPLLISLFHKNNSDISVYEKLKKYTKLDITEEDQGTTYICLQCRSELDITVKFLLKCEQSNSVLSNDKSSKNNEVMKRKCSDVDGDVENNLFHIKDECLPSLDDILDGYYNEKVNGQLEVGSQAKPKGTLMKKGKCFECEHCKKVFNRNSNYQLHLKRHSGERNHPCAKCGRLLLTAWMAERHCMPRARHPCPIDGCHLSFTSTANLTTHIRKHSGERPHQCIVCGKHFACKNTLNDHLRIHTGEKPYICSVCGKQFRTNKLSVHMRVHTGNRPHPCPFPECPRACTSPRSLALHVLTHGPPTKQYACDLCPVRYNHSQSLNKHLRKMHGKKPRPATRESSKLVTIGHG